MFINTPETDAIDLKNTKIYNADLGTILNTKSAIYLRTERTGTLKDWKKIYPVTTSIQLVDEFANQLFAVNKQVLFSGSDGVEVKVDNDGIYISGNLHFGAKAPINIPENKTELVIYFNTSDNTLYFWNPITLRWHGPFISYEFKESSTTRIDTVNNVVYLPKVLPVAKVKLVEKKAMVAVLSGKESIANTPLKYKWSMAMGNASLVGDENANVTVIAHSANPVKVKLTITDEHGNTSSETSDVLFSYYLQVQGPNNGETSFATLGDAFAWIRANDALNEKKYYIEVFNTTEEQEETLFPTQTTVFFKNGSINVPVEFNNGEYFWYGSKSIHLYNKIRTNNATVKLYNIDINAVNGFAIEAKDSKLDFDSVEIQSSIGGIQLFGGSLELNHSTINSIRGSALEAIDGKITIKHSYLTSFESDLTAVLINCDNEIEYTKFIQLNPDGLHSVEIASDKEVNITTFANSNISNAAVMQEDELCSALNIKGVITVILDNLSIYAKKCIALTMTNPERITVTNCHLSGRYSLLINDNLSDVLQPDKSKVLNNMRGTYLIGEALVTSLPRHNVYEL